MKTLFRIAVVALLSIGLSAGLSAQTKKFTVKDLPAAVKSAFTTAYPKAEIKGVDKEVEKGVTYYEIESIDGKLKRDLLYLADGKVFELEEAVAADAMPAAVTKALKANSKSYEFIKAEKVVRGSDVSFSVTFKNGKKTFESSVTDQGKVLSTKEMKKKKEAKEEKEEDEEKEEK